MADYIYGQPDAADESNPYGKPAPKPSGALRKAVGDKVVGFASGAVGATKAIADAVGAGNVVSNTLDNANKGVNDYLSPEAKADQQAHSARSEQAKGTGAWNEFKAGVQNFAESPIQQTVTGVGSIAPVALAALGGLPAAAATGIAMGAGTVKGRIYDDTKKRGIDAGLSAADADAAATKAQNYTGENTDQIALGGALGAADALTGAGRVAGGMLRNAVMKPAISAIPKAVERGIVGRAAMGALVEFPLEAAQGGQEQLATNIAAQRQGVNVDTWSGVAGQATEEGLASLGSGAAFGVARGRNANTAPPGVVPPPAVPPAPPLQIGNTPDPYISFPDGTVARRSEADAYVNSLPADQQPAARAKLMGLAPQPAKPSEQMGLTPTAGPSLTNAAITAVDSGAAQVNIDQAPAEQTDIVEQQRQQYQQETAALLAQQDQEAFDAYLAAIEDANTALDEAPGESVQALSQLDDISVPDIFDANSNTSDADFLRAMGATEQEIADAITNQPGSPQAGTPNPVGTAQDEPGSTGQGVSADQTKQANLERIRKANNVSPPDSVQPIPATSSGQDGNQPAASVGLGSTDGNGLGANAAGSESGAVGQSGEQASGALRTPIAQGRQQPTTLGTQTKANAGPGFTVKDVQGVQNNTPAANEPKAGQAPVEAPQAVAGDAAPSGGVPAAGSAAVEGDGVEPKAKWLKAINDQNRLAGDTGVQLKVVDGKLTFYGDPKSTKQGRALEATLAEARKAGATQQEIIGSISQPAATNPAAGVGPASLGSVKADMDHLFGIDQKRAKALDRIAAGKAWFANGIKAQQFIATNGLKDTHKAVKTSATRFDVVAKDSQPTKSTNEKATEAQPQQAKPKAGTTAGVQQPTASSAVAGEAEGVSRSILNTNGPHFASGVSDFKAGKPRVLPSYFTKATGKNSKDWYRGWDAANAAAPVASSSPEAVSAQGEGLNDHIRALRAVAHNGIKQGGPKGDVRLNMRGSNLYVPFDVAVAEARKAVAAGMKPVPFQVSSTLDIGIGETDRVIAALSKPEIVVDKAEMRPYRKPDGSVGYEAVPIQEATPAADTPKTGAERLDERIKSDVANKPGTVNVPSTIAEAFTSQMQKQKGRITRLKNEAEKAGSLEDKRAAQLKVTAAEATLRQMRLKIFDAEDAAVKSVDAGNTKAFADYADLFPVAAEEIAKLTGQNDELDAEMRSYEAKKNPTYSGSPAIRQKLETIAQRLGFSVNKSQTGWHASGGMISIPSEDADLSSAVSADHVFAHELGHGIMDKRGVSVKGFPDVELRKRVANWDELVAASKDFRPGVHNHASDSARKHAKKANEIAADAIASVLIGDKPLTMLQPFMDWLGINKVDLGLQTVAEANAESRAAKVSDQKAPQALENTSPVATESVAKADAKAVLSEKEKAAKAKMFNALGKLAHLAGKNTRMNWTQEEEQQLLPIVIELFDGAMELGAVTFQQAVAYVREFISTNLDQETADAIPFDTLQGAYISVAGRHKDKGVTSKKEVVSFESLAELENSGEQADTSIKDQPNEPTTGNQPDTSSTGVQDEQPGKLQPDAGTVRRGNAKSNTGNASRGTDKNSPPDFVPAAGGLTREGSWFETAKRNIDLIELAIQIEADKRPATPAEQARLAKYVGFGASAIRNELFPVPPAWAKAQEPSRLIWPQYVRNDRFKPLAERIEALPREWQQSILQSSQYAHYTSEGIIRSVWSALQRMGFMGGQVFEPGMGIGSFSMLMPDAIRAESRYTGVEFDAPTALIAKLLSPQQNMLHGDFIKGKYPKNFFDVNVGNPPFAQTKIFGDPEYAKKGFMIHDFFFAKGIDLVRPGGIQVFVTSKGTMDKQTDKARKYLSERADLLGAIRLPSTAFEDNAGTSVVTDVIFLRKRQPGEAPAGESWANTATVETQDGPVVVNEYFAKHPEMVLGQQRISGNTDDQGRRINSNGMGGEKYTVVSYDTTPAELEAKFAKAIEQLPKDAYSEKKGGTEKAKDARVDFDPSVKREGVVYLSKDGTLMRVAEGVGVPLANTTKLNDKDQAWFKSYVGLRDLVQEARFAQLNEKAWEAALAKLNKAYDKFVKEHGHILDYRVMTRKSTDEEGNVVETESRIPKNRRLLREDYDQALVTSLESIAEDGSIVKSPFLKGRTIGKPVSREVKSIGDALAVSLDDTGHFDLADVGKRLKLDEEATIEALGNQIYQTPDGQWQLADEYLAGDVVAKLEEAEAAARINPDLKRNVEALKEAQPEKLGPAQISAKLGASWIPEAHVNEFSKEIGAGQVTFDHRTETWQVDGGNKQTGRMAGAEYGTARRSPSELLEAILNSRSIKITQTIDKKTVPDQAATTAANEMAKKIKDKFKGWVWTDTDRATELVESYNKNFNNLAPRKFDGSHLTLPGVSLRYKLHPHQLRAIWRMIQTGNTYLAHAVGAGKTIEMIAGGMEQKRLGLIKKPIYVVPNHMLEQFSNEFMELYPLANIMVADDENFSPERRKAFIASATMNNPDAIVITHDAFQRIGVKEESVAPIRDEILSDLEIELSETAKGNDTRVRRGQLEQQIEAVKQRFDRIVGAGAKDSTIKFEDMGVDFVFADEAHVFRKLDFHTAQQIKGIDPNGSKRALDMYVKTRILDKRKPGRSMVFASGTPVTNTMGELYTIMRFFGGAELDKAGISTFDAWARQFGEVAPALEPNAAGKYELIERFAKFDNVPELMSRVRQFMDVLTSDNLGALVKRPNIKGGKPNLNIIPTNSDLTDYMKGELARRIDISREWKPSKDEPHNPDPIVAIITDGRFAAIDPRFFGGALKEGDKSIITEMGDKVAASYHATKNDVYLDKEGKEEKIKGSTQIVFYNLGFGEQSQKSRGFNSRAAFTKRLTDGGIPRAEIAWFDDANSDAKKEAVFKAMRNGTIKVLIGSAKKMGTGVNVQKRLAVLHYQDPPWFPADVEQPHGRILRQGNQNEEIAIEWYTTKGTYQSTMWQMVGRKQRFIDQAFTGDKTLRSMDDLGEASLFEQAAAVASGDPRAIQLAGLKQDVERFTRLQAAHANEQINVRSALNSATWQIESGQRFIKTLEKAFKAIGEKYFAFTSGRVNGRDYTKPGEFGQAIKDAFNKVAADSVMGEPVRDKTIASLGDAIKVTMDASIGKGDKPDGTFDIHVEFGGSSFQLANTAAMGVDVDAAGLARRIFNKVNDVDSDLQRRRRELTANETDAIKLRKKLGAPFEYQQEMAEKYGELKRLEAELEAEGKATPAAKTSLVIKADGTTNGEAPEASTNLNQTGAPEGNTSDVVFSQGLLSPASFGPKPTLDQIQGLVDKVLQVAKNVIPVSVIASPHEIAGVKVPVGAKPTGALIDGRIYLFADNIQSIGDAYVTLFHELFHLGLQKVIPAEDYATLLRQFSRNLLVQKFVREWKASPEGVEKAGTMNSAAYDALAAEEALAMVSEELSISNGIGTNRTPGLVKAMLSWIAEVVDKMGFPASFGKWIRGLTQTEAERFVSQMVSAAMGGDKNLGRTQSKYGTLDAKMTAQTRLSDGNAQSSGIRFRSLDSALTQAANSVRDVNLPAGYKVGDLFNAVPGKLNWWYRTLGTQYNLAQRSPAFKRVYDAVQTFINDVSYFATEAADMAPNILPKLESWKDLAKSPLSAADTKALSAPVFEGTLIWARDESGKAVKMETLEAKAKTMTPEQKAQRLLRGDHISEQMLKTWKGLPIDQYERLVNDKYEDSMLKAGIVFKDAELTALFGLSDKQIALYREFRKATDKSLANLAIADMLRFGGKDADPVRDVVLESKSVKDAADTLSKYLRSLADLDPDRATVLMDTANKMIDKGDKAQGLMDRGYAPLSRFGSYTLDVVDANGERAYFGMFESAAEASRMRRKMEGLYPGSRITQGTVSEQAYKMFAGVSPETLELFGDMLGLETQGDDTASQAFQEYLKLAKSSRSAMKRLIQRKGIAGFSEDAGRVLAGFVYSNARQTATSLHMGEMTQAAADNDAFRNQGETQDAAVKLVDYIKNPQEEAQKLRGLLFAQYIGGSVASAMVNMTQPITMTFPWLSQYGGVASAAKQMTAAIKDVGKPSTGDTKLDAALRKAEEDGTVSPQEVHQLLKQSQGRSALQSDDGTRAGYAMALAQNTVSRFSLVWGKLFSVAEQFNRRVTFIAAYRTAVAQGMADPDEFARKAISETQGVYNKGNKPAWARGAVGSTLFTFKQYSIAYVEMLSRMAKSGPEGKKAALLALAVLFLLSGAGGMPGADDLDDVISGAMQAMGYNFDSKMKRKEFFVSLLGEGGAQFVERGVSGLPGVPLDVSGRMGLGNLIPGTGLLTKKADHTRDVAEIAGPAGDFVKRGFDAAGKLITGNVAGAVNSIAPKAIQNITQAFDMANMGMYRDTKGMKVLDTDMGDAVVKAIGFQPNDVKRAQDANSEVARMIGLNKIVETEIANRWAIGIFEKDTDKVQAARDDLAGWNRSNPESPIRINFTQIRSRVQKMNQTKAERIAKTAPREIRAAVRKELADAR